MKVEDQVSLGNLLKDDLETERRWPSQGRGGGYVLHKVLKTDCVVQELGPLLSHFS